MTIPFRLATSCSLSAPTYRISSTTKMKQQENGYQNFVSFGNAMCASCKVSPSCHVRYLENHTCLLSLQAQTAWWGIFERMQAALRVSARKANIANELKYKYFWSGQPFLVYYTVAHSFVSSK